MYRAAAPMLALLRCLSARAQAPAAAAAGAATPPPSSWTLSLSEPVIVAGHINTSLFKAKDAVRNLDNTLGIPCLFFGMEWPYSSSIWSSVPTPRTPHASAGAPHRHHPIPV